MKGGDDQGAGGSQKRNLSTWARFGHRCFAIVLVALAPALFGPSHAAESTDSISGIWLPDPQRSERPRDLPFTAAGRAAVESFRASHHPVKDDPGAFCLPAGMPQTAIGGADYPLEIIVTPRQVTMLFELHQQVRRIYLDRSAHPTDSIPQRNGHSIGRWEKDVLLIETAGLREVLFGGFPHSDQARIQERVRATDGGAALLNEITITDPAMYSRPIVVRQFYAAAPPEVGMLEYDCTEGLWADHLEGKARGR